jgi:hypothetical protein
MRDRVLMAACFSLLLLIVMSAPLAAAPRQHAILLGRWRTVHLTGETASAENATARIRELMIDGRLREYTFGPLHEVTDRLFVIRRVERLNDSLPQDGQKSRWVWQLGGWMSVDRQNGHVAQLTLPAFDPVISRANWYRDYVAYCGSSDDGARLYTVVFQLGKRKPLLKKEVTGSTTDCAVPKWERNPSRVTFVVGGAKSSFVVGARGAELQSEINTEEEGPQ